MWTGLENMVPRVKEGGKLFLATYNDQGRLSRFWRVIKRADTRTHPTLRFLILWPMALFLMILLIGKDLLCLRRPRFLSSPMICEACQTGQTWLIRGWLSL